MRFSESARSIFSLWVQNKRVIEKGWNFDKQLNSGKKVLLKKRSGFDLGSAFFGISEVGFLPYGVQMKGVIEKGWNFDKKCFFE